jgi:hypothetical protein
MHLRALLNRSSEKVCEHVAVRTFMTTKLSKDCAANNTSANHYRVVHERLSTNREVPRNEPLLWPAALRPAAGSGAVLHVCRHACVRACVRALERE